MRLTNYLLNEKFTKKEMKDVFNNENIWIGAEFEFISYRMEEHVTKPDDVRREYQDALDDWREYVEEKVRLEDEINNLKDKLGDLKDEKNDLDSQLIDLENEDDRDEDEINKLEDKISDIEDKISDVESDLDSNEEILEYFIIGGYYIRYMENYIGQYEIDGELSSPPDPSELEELGYLSRLRDEYEWINIAEDVLPSIIEDASWTMEDYDIGGYKDIDQKKVIILEHLSMIDLFLLQAGWKWKPHQ